MKLIPKKLRQFSHVSEHNWLIHQLMVDFLSEAAANHASNVLVDIGCGQKPYRHIFSDYVTKHIGIDLATSPYVDESVDIIGDAYQTNLDDSSCDVVLCTEVLEHLEEPQRAIQEIHRILKHKGKVILTVPFFWHIHEPPRDFYRYSRYGLRYLFEKGGFEVVELKPISGFIVTFTQLSIYYFLRFQKGFILRPFGRLFNWIFQYFALFANRYDQSTKFTNLYCLVAEKK